MAEPTKLHAEVLRWIDRSYTGIVGTASTIAAKTTDRTVRENTLRWKYRTLVAVEYMASKPDPRGTFLLSWVFVTQSRLYLTEGEGKALFGAQQALAVEQVQKMEDEILALGGAHFGESLIRASMDDVAALVRASPVIRFGLAEMAGDEVGEITSLDNTVARLLQMPLAPFSGLQGVADTPTAIRDFTATAKSFMDVVHHIPRRMRWESELLLQEVDSLDTVVKARESLERASRSMESFAKTAATLPSDVRREIEGLLPATSETQEKLQATVREVQKAASELRETLATLEVATMTVREGLEQVAKSGDSWAGAAREVQGVMRAYKDLSTGNALETNVKKNDEEKTSARPEDYRRVAEEISRASGELRLLLGDLQSDKLTTALAQVSRASRATVEHAASEAGDLVDKITLRLALLFSGGFVGVIAYRALVQRRKRNLAV